MIQMVIRRSEMDVDQQDIVGREERACGKGACGMTDQNLAFLKKFISIYQELLAHDGYGDITVKIRLLQQKKKEVFLQCGREYRFQIDMPPPHQKWRRYKIVDMNVAGGSYSEPDRRSGRDRRDYSRQRRCQELPRNFKLERRLKPDRRRSGQRGRRFDD